MRNLCQWDSSTGNNSARRIWLTFGRWRLHWSLGADLAIRPEVLTLQSRKPRPSEKWAWSFSRCLLWKWRRHCSTVWSDLLFLVLLKLDNKLLQIVDNRQLHLKCSGGCVCVCVCVCVSHQIHRNAPSSGKVKVAEWAPAKSLSKCGKFGWGW